MMTRPAKAVAISKLAWLTVAAMAATTITFATTAAPATTAASAVAAVATVATVPTVPTVPTVAATGSALQALANLREEVVLAGAVINGNRLDLTRFVDDRSAEALLEEVRRIWSQRAAPIHRTARDGWLTLTQLAGSSIETFEVRARGTGAEGRRSRLRKGDDGLAQTSAWLEAALPAGSRVLERLSHQDGGRQMTTLVAVTSLAATVASLDLLAALNRKGFRYEARSAPSFDLKGLVFFLARGTEELAVTISDHAGQRAIVMHWGRAVQ